MYRMHKYLTVEGCKLFIQALVISHLDYCCSLLLGTKKAYIDHLHHLQNSAVRFIFTFFNIKVPNHIYNSFIEKVFSYMGPALWNNIDNSVRAATSVDIFQKELNLKKKVYNC